MRRLISSILSMGLLIGLAVLAALARPAQGPAEAATAPAASSLRVATAPTPAQQQRDAVSAPAMTSKETEKNSTVPTAVQKPNGNGVSPVKSSVESQNKSGVAPDALTSSLGWNVVALPLDVAGVDFADNAAYYISTGDPTNSTNNKISQVAHWVSGQWVYRRVGGGLGAGTNFAVSPGEPLLLNAAADAPTLFAWVGDVPQAGSIHYSLPQSGWHVIMLPLDENVDTDNNGTPTADELGNDIGGIGQVAQWVSGQWVYRRVGGGLGAGVNFTIKNGYPYLLQTSATTPTSWP